MVQPSAQDEWTIQDGVRDVMRFLGRRALVALPLWMLAAFVLTYFARLGAPAGEFSIFMLVIALASTGAGAPIGLTMSRGLIDDVGFTGWIPAGLAAAATAAVIGAGSAVMALIYPPHNAFFGFLMPLAAIPGGLGAVYKSTWLEG